MSRFSTQVTNVTTSCFDENGEERLLKSLNFGNFAFMDNDKHCLRIDYTGLRNEYREATGKDVVPTYLLFDVTSDIFVEVHEENASNAVVSAGSFDDKLVILIDDKNQPMETYNKYLRNGFYVHGRSGTFDEINYKDEDMTNQILPCK